MVGFKKSAKTLGSDKLYQSDLAYLNRCEKGVKQINDKVSFVFWQNHSGCSHKMYWNREVLPPGKPLADEIIQVGGDTDPRKSDSVGEGKGTDTGDRKEEISTGLGD